MPPCPNLLITAMRREILDVLAEPGALPVPAATAQVATEWSARRRQHGHSPSSARTTAALVYQVGADLASDLAVDRTRVLRDLGPPGGTRMRLDRLGRLADAGPQPHTGRPASTCHHGNHVFCTGACDCACHDRPLAGPDRPRTDR